MASNQGPQLSPQEERELILNELARVSSTSQASWGSIAAILSFVVAAVVAYFLRDSGTTGINTTLQDAILAFVTLLLLMSAGYLVLLFAQQVVQGHYSRDLEKRLIQLISPPQDDRAKRAAYDDPDQIVLVGASENIIAALVSNRRGVPEVRRLFKLIVFILLASITGILSFNISRVHSTPAKIGLIVVAVVFASYGIRLGFRAVSRGSLLWRQVKRGALVEVGMAEPTDTRPTWRLPAYLLLPRPTEFVLKGLMLHFLPAVAGAIYMQGAVSIGTSLRYAAISCLCFEVLLYQARYMINDFRGYREDSRHPSRSRNPRLPSLWTDQPGGAEPARDRPRWLLFWFVCVIRIVAPFVIVWLWLDHFRVEFTVAFGLVIALSMVYEWLRSLGHLSVRLGARDLSLFLVVGAGYAIRAGLGFDVGSRGLAPTALVVMFAAAFYLSGLSTVLVVWTLELSQYLTIGAHDGALLARIRAAQAAGPAASFVVAAPLMAKHVDLALLGSKRHFIPLGIRAELMDAHSFDSAVPDLGQSTRSSGTADETELRERLSHARLVRSPAWWRPFHAYPAALAVAGAVTAGWLAERGPGHAASAVTLVIAATIGLAVGVAQIRFVWPTASLLWIGFAASVAVSLFDADQRHAWMLLLPAAVVAATYGRATSMSYDDTQHPFQRIARTCAHLPAAVSAWVQAIVR